ncbi:MAG: ATP-binding cassette domain-containing protein, partial [Hydrotalea flava]|nr:ATP-binding cassette domain-containing protein [Hydrotalea flava]
MVVILKNVIKKYNPLSNLQPEIKNVNLEIKDGEFFVLLGPSGCGKSTLLNLIAGFIELTSGEILVNGKKVNGSSWERGVIFQNTDTALFPWLNVKENVEFGLKMRGIKEREKIFEKYINMVSL